MQAVAPQVESCATEAGVVAGKFVFVLDGSLKAVTANLDSSDTRMPPHTERAAFLACAENAMRAARLPAFHSKTGEFHVRFPFSVGKNVPAAQKRE
jgi:hypothetical protein